MTVADRKSIQSILVPIDFSGHSEAALRSAIEFAKAYGATVHLMHALPHPQDIRMTGGWWAALRARTMEELNRLSDLCAEAEVPCVTHVSDDEPRQAILDLVIKTQADMIAMGTAGRNALGRMMLGSVTGPIVRLAPCPVLTVRAD